MAGNYLGTCLCSFLSAGMFMAGIITLFVAAFPIIQITLGAFYLNECPVAPAIPVYVMVSGIWALLMMGLLALPKLFPAAGVHIMWTVCLFILVLFSFSWFIYGSYHIYSVHPPNYNKNTTISNSSTHSIYAPTAPDNNLSLEKQRLPNLNQTRMISDNQTRMISDNQTRMISNNQTRMISNNQTRMISNNQTRMFSNNQTLMKLIQTVALSSINNKTNTEQPRTLQINHVKAVVPYCDRIIYLFAFWTTTLVLALAGNGLLIFICVFGFVKLLNWIVKFAV